ncbi:Uncharacterised protein [Raoultella planticola]|nr:Uncharacterised protein [Raoultella planticola]
MITVTLQPITVVLCDCYHFNFCKNNDRLSEINLKATGWLPDLIYCGENGQLLNDKLNCPFRTRKIITVIFHG